MEKASQASEVKHERQENDSEMNNDMPAERKKPARVRQSTDPDASEGENQGGEAEEDEEEGDTIPVAADAEGRQI